MLLKDLLPLTFECTKGKEDISGNFLNNEENFEYLKRNLSTL
jgi:hypothetical protein